MNHTTSYKLRQPTTFSVIARDNPKDPDLVLSQAAAVGSKSAIESLYQRHRRRVYLLCFRMTRNAADAEDLTQEVFIHLFRKISSFRGESQFTSWLHRLTVNLVLMHVRRKVSRRGEITDDVAAKIAIHQKSKQTAAGQTIDRIALNAALDQLPVGTRSVFELFDIEGYCHHEIATMLGCAVGTSKSQLHKARRKLRLLLN